MIRPLLIAFLLETGFMLIVLPWSTFWDHNYFASAVPLVRVALTNNFVRGAVSGLGIVNMAAAAIDLATLMSRRRHVERRSAGITPSALEE
jgi:hypothetical protein